MPCWLLLDDTSHEHQEHALLYIRPIYKQHLPFYILIYVGTFSTSVQHFRSSLLRIDIAPIRRKYIRLVLTFENVLSSTTFVHESPIGELSPSRWALALTVILSQHVILQSWQGSWVLSCLQ